MPKLVLLLALVSSFPAPAQTYPTQPIRLIAPFPPGGSVDIMARLIAEPLAAQLGGKIVIDNRSGASGNIGMEAAARSKPDGYTVGPQYDSARHQPGALRQAHLGPDQGFRADRHGGDRGARAGDSPESQSQQHRRAGTARALESGKLSYASAGVGTTFHLCGEMFKDSTQTFILHVPYRGGGPALADTLGGQVDMSFPTISAAVPHIKAGPCARSRSPTCGARRSCRTFRRCARPASRISSSRSGSRSSRRRTRRAKW